MRKERKNIGIDRIQLNTGQLDWLPRNPRTWAQEDIDRTAASIAEDPDFLEERPILVVPFGKEYVAFGGNLRHEGCAQLGRPSAPCVVYYPESDEDRETVKRRAMKDNGTFGKWDWDTLANEWDDEPLTDWGVPVWPQQENEETPGESESNQGQGETRPAPPQDGKTQNTKTESFVCKITFPDADKKQRFIESYKAIVEDEFRCVLSE